jgi:hypothetical protein
MYKKKKKKAQLSLYFYIWEELPVSGGHTPTDLLTLIEIVITKGGTTAQRGTTGTGGGDNGDNRELGPNKTLPLVVG